MDPEVILNMALRVLMIEDEKMGRKEKRHIERSVRLVFHQGPLRFHEKNDAPTLWEELAGDFPQLGVPLDIYTDGAWEKKRGTVEDVFMYLTLEHIEGSSGIVITAAGEN